MEKENFKNSFIKLFKDEEYFLPKRWDGKDFAKTVYFFFEKYIKNVQEIFPENEYKDFISEIESVARYIYTAIVNSFRGKLEEAYININNAMVKLFTYPLFLSDNDLTEENLFRVVDVGDNAEHDRNRVFHVPFSMRTRMSTQRFSIPGFPCLYLGTSLKLCCEEIGADTISPTLIGAKFIPNLQKNQHHSGKSSSSDNNVFQIYDLSVRPQDFKQNEEISFLSHRNYLIWYPLIATCSFVRAKTSEPYAPEYIIPQILMQWIRDDKLEYIVGIKYLSCKAPNNSIMDYNYAFPTTGLSYRIRNSIVDYDAQLSHRFKLTEPVYLRDFETLEDCQLFLEATPKSKYKIIETEKKEKPKKKYIIQEGEAEIGNKAFKDCKKIEEISIPNSIISIGEEAFENCIGLKDIIIPDSVVSIGKSTFFACTSLEKVILSKSLSSLPMSIFHGCKNLKDISIPETIWHIGFKAFSGCTSLKNIYIPASIKFIEDNAFKDCPSLTIYCEAKKQPKEWEKNWNPEKCPVKWGVTREEYEKIKD